MLTVIHGDGRAQESLKSATDCMDFENMSKEAVDLIIQNNLRMFEKHGYNPEGEPSGLNDDFHDEVRNSELHALIAGSDLKIEQDSSVSATLSALENLSRFGDLDDADIDLDVPVAPVHKGLDQ